MFFAKNKRLRSVLKNYNSNLNYWNKDASKLSAEEARENLTGFLSDRKAHRVYLQDIFKEGFDICLEELFLDQAFMKTCSKLNQWGTNFFPEVFQKRYSNTEEFFNRPFSKKDIILVVLSDIGFYLGDVIILNNSEYEWAIVDSLSPQSDYEFRRPVLLGNDKSYIDIERLTYKQFSNFHHEYHIAVKAFGKKNAIGNMDSNSQFTAHLQRILNIPISP